jgi:hypothetical protein
MLDSVLTFLASDSGRNILASVAALITIGGFAYRMYVRLLRRRSPVPVVRKPEDLVHAPRTSVTKPPVWVHAPVDTASLVTEVITLTFLAASIGFTVGLVLIISFGWPPWVGISVGIGAVLVLGLLLRTAQ